jgi:hypothetical protein
MKSISAMPLHAMALIGIFDQGIPVLRAIGRLLSNRNCES